MAIQTSYRKQWPCTRVIVALNSNLPASQVELNKYGSINKIQMAAQTSECAEDDPYFRSCSFTLGVKTE